MKKKIEENFFQNSSSVWIRRQIQTMNDSEKRLHDARHVDVQVEYRRVIRLKKTNEWIHALIIERKTMKNQTRAKWREVKYVNIVKKKMKDKMKDEMKDTFIENDFYVK